MRLDELKRAVRGYGLRVPCGIISGTVNHFWLDFFDFDPIGSGYQRRYSTHHLRRLVSWLTIRSFTTGPRRGGRHQVELHRHAMRLMAAASEGWIVMSNGRAHWSLVEPVAAIRHGAVALPVPDWLPEHQPR